VRGWLRLGKAIPSFPKEGFPSRLWSARLRDGAKGRRMISQGEIPGFQSGFPPSRAFRDPMHANARIMYISFKQASREACITMRSDHPCCTHKTCPTGHGHMIVTGGAFGNKCFAFALLTRKTSFPKSPTLGITAFTTPDHPPCAVSYHSTASKPAYLPLERPNALLRLHLTGCR